MARKQEPTLRLADLRGDFEDALQNYMLKAGLLAAKVDDLIELDQIKTPAVAASLKQLLDDFRAS
jgi:hypothetical protein